MGGALQWAPRLFVPTTVRVSFATTKEQSSRRDVRSAMKPDDSDIAWYRESGGVVATRGTRRSELWCAYGQAALSITMLHRASSRGTFHA